MTEKISPARFEKYLARRESEAHKGSFGRALLICGSFGMAGAAVLSARAALRSGVGLCECLLPPDIYPIVSAAVPEAVFTPDDSLRTVLKRVQAAGAVLIGCGLGAGRQAAEAVQMVCETCERPLVIDADGINAICGHIDVLEKHQSDVILTPHPGEMARLIGTSAAQIQSRREETAREFAARTGTILVLKGHETVVALPGGETFVNPTGNPGMATGGSGDVLAGILVSLLAQGLPAAEAAMAAVYIHGLAGDRSAARLSPLAMLPSEIIERLPEVFLEFEKQRGVELEK